LLVSTLLEILLLHDYSVKLLSVGKIVSTLLEILPWIVKLRGRPAALRPVSTLLEILPNTEVDTALEILVVSTLLEILPFSLLFFLIL